MTVVSEADRAVGMEVYATDSRPCGAMVKASPEDFRVEEITAVQGIITDQRPEFFPLYKVENNFIDTLHMTELLSKALKSRVSFGGLKDKRALSTQFVTPTSLRSERPKEVIEERFTARLVGYVPTPISRGAVVGNRFEIVLRDCCEQVGEVIQGVIRKAEEKRLPSFYGLQRFGVGGAGTHEIGREIVLGRFQEAVRRLLTGTSDPRAESGPIWEAVKGDRPEEAIGLLPSGQDVERRVVRELSRHRGEWIKALRAVPIRLRRLYVHAFQSYLFNKSLSLALAKGEDISAYQQGDNWAALSNDGLAVRKVGGVNDRPRGFVVPMLQVVGYAFRNYGTRFDSCVADVLRSEQVEPARFYVQEMQEVSSEGGFRRPHLALKNPVWRVEGGKVELGFTLAKGQYATVLLREIIKAEDPVGAGLA